MKLKEFGEDLTSTLYAKIWLALWVVVLIFAFVFFGNFVFMSDINVLNQNYRMSITEPDLIQYPKFKAELQSSNITFAVFKCAVGSKIVSVEPCANSKYECNVVKFDEFYSLKGEDGQDTPACILVFTYKGDPQLINAAVRWSIIGEEEVLSAVVDPTDDAAILLTKEIYNLPNSTTLVEYNPHTVYYNDALQQEAMIVRIMFDSHFVKNFSQFNYYTLWMLIADLGGAMVCLYVIHTLLMTCVECCIPNDTKSIGKQSYRSV
eukprot:TRINITY_DN10334_c0_g1_i1.p1 TRINITY_DN10334_c0_g1~~TRINITY_DN10334_c0_g1_i1.p1  ORF type:complete len:263 (+),score=59.11 TRINITY_DN10334_c0_g1_i1:12-800(+)